MGRMVDTLPIGTSPQEGGGVAIVCDVMSILADLSVTEFLCQVVAHVHGVVVLNVGTILIGGRGNQNFVAHWVSFELKSL